MIFIKNVVKKIFYKNYVYVYFEKKCNRIIVLLKKIIFKYFDRIIIFNFINKFPCVN